MSEDGGTNQFIVCDSNQTNNVATDNVSDISAKILQHPHPVSNITALVTYQLKLALSIFMINQINIRIHY